MAMSGAILVSIVVFTVLCLTAEGYPEPPKAGQKMGECMPESKCRNSGGVKGYNSEHKCVQTSIDSIEKQVYCTTYAHLAKDLCSTWVEQWADHDNSCSMNMFLRKATNYIVNGKVAEEGEFKHMVAVGRFVISNNNVKWECGGALISPFFVLTAAHCIGDEWDTYYVKVGEHDMGDMRETEIDKEVIKIKLPAYLHRSTEYNQTLKNVTRLEKQMRVKKVIMHPKYLPQQNDIALLELEDPALLNENVLPACIPYDIEADPDVGQILTASGWGAKKYGGNPARKLQKVDIPVVDTETCQESFNGSINADITPKHLCAGGNEGETCQGDSGGSLGNKVSREDGRECGFQTFGIVSWGDACRKMGVYTRVSSYIDWIMQYLAPEHYYKYVFENIYDGGLEFDGMDAIQFVINSNIFTDGFKIELHFKTSKQNSILIKIPTTQEGAYITLGMANKKVVFSEPLGNVMLESESNYIDDTWYLMSAECILRTKTCYLKISEESLEAPWSVPSSTEDGIITTLIMGGGEEEIKRKRFKGYLLYYLSSTVQLKYINSSYGTVIANDGSSPAGGNTDAASFSALYAEKRFNTLDQRLDQDMSAREKRSIILDQRLDQDMLAREKRFNSIEQVLQDISAKVTNIIPDLSERLLQDISAKMTDIISDLSDSSHSVSASSSCTPSYVLIGSECLLFGKLPSTLSEAKDSCETMGAKLATPVDLEKLQAYMNSNDLSAYYWVDGNSTSAKEIGQTVLEDCYGKVSRFHAISNVESCLQYHPSKDGYCNNSSCGEEDTATARYICKSLQGPKL